MDMRENIEVIVGTAAAAEVGKEKYAVISDRKSGRAWTGEGPSESAAATEATRKFLGDRRTREYVG